MKFIRRPSSPNRSISRINRAFSKVAIQEVHDWKAACHLDLKIPRDVVSQFTWRELYASSVDGSHAYSLRESNRHIDRKRIGSFRVQTGDVLVSGNLSSLASSVVKMESTLDDIRACDSSLVVLTDLQLGGWIADLNLLKCSLCTDPACEGTVQVLDARHSELFLHEEYRSGEWKYEEIGEYYVHPPFTSVSVGIFDAGHITSDSSKELLNVEAWVHSPDACVPAIMSHLFAAGAITNIDQNEDKTKGLMMTLHTMKAGKDGAIVAVRMCQCLAP